MCIRHALLLLVTSYWFELSTFDISLEMPALCAFASAMTNPCLMSSRLAHLKGTVICHNDSLLVIGLAAIQLFQV